MLNHIKHAAAATRNALNRLRYRRLRAICGLDESAVLLDQQHGLTVDGNLSYIARELADESRYGELSLYFTVNRRARKTIVDQLNRQGLRVKPVVRSSRRYYELLATAKTLVADTSFPPVFTKREGQIYWNTWHGTPLKTLGRAERAEAHLIGNVQKNLAAADFLSFPNEYTARRIVDDYEIAKHGKPILLFAEYPRNEAFARPADPSTRAQFVPEGKRAYAYLPTFRFSPEDESKAASVELIAQHLAEIDALLTDEEILFVKLHPAINRAFDLTSFIHVKPIPSVIELYQFLNLCDALVTDYSSVMFDFAITRRKIVLFTFDEEEYLSTRGLYLPLDELPFPRTDNTASLVNELRAPKEYEDGPFLERFAPYPAARTTEKLCRRIFEGEAELISEATLEEFTNETPL